MIGDTPLQSFDLPDHLEADHVAIYPNENEDGPNWIAVPFVEETTFDDGSRSLREPHDHEPTPEYREAVLEKALVPTSELQFDRTIPHEEL